MYENINQGGEPVFVGVHIQPDGTFGARLRVVEVRIAPVVVGNARLDAALLRLGSDATDHGAEIAAIFEGELPVSVRTTTVGIGVAFEGAELEYYESEVAELGRCIMGRADFDPVHDFCVGIPGSTQRTGYGDSGGPLYVPARGLHGGFRLAGIVKGGVKAGLAGSEETEFIRYADVTRLQGWIRNVLDAAE